MKRMTVWVLTCMLCLALCACGSSAQPTEAVTEPATVATTEAPTEPAISQEELAAAYHESMAAVLEQELETAPVANLAVAYVEYAGNAAKEEHDPPIYTRQYLPESFAAETPEEVCYIVRCIHNADVAGFYGMAGAPVGTDPAYRRNLTVQIVDRFTGNTLQEAVFQGEEPPQTILDGESHYGSYPDEEEVTTWLETALKEANEARLADAVEYAQNQTSKYNISQIGLIRRMTEFSPQYSIPEAEYAAQNCGIDWNEKALLCLQEELADTEDGTFANYRSYKGCVYYLKHFKDFTEEQAVYAVDNCGADWKEQAVIAGEQLKTWERDLMINWMTMPVASGGFAFTEEEAEYAADHYGLK